MLYGIIERNIGKDARIFVFDSKSYGFMDYSDKVEYIGSEGEVLDMVDEIAEEYTFTNWI